MCFVWGGDPVLVPDLVAIPIPLIRMKYMLVLFWGGEFQFLIQIQEHYDDLI